MQQQVVSSMNVSNDDNKTDCFSYIVEQFNFHIENLGIVVKKVLCKPWPLLSKQSIRKKKKQVNNTFLLKVLRKTACLAYNHFLSSTIYYSKYILSIHE
jgi:hypothetical protein